MDGATIENDQWANAQQFEEFLTKAFANAKDVMKDGAAFYIWFATKEHMRFEGALNRVGLQNRQEIIWNKNALVLSRQDYQWKHEPCLYGWKEGAAHYFFDSRKETTVIEDRIDIDKLKKEEMRDLLKQIYSQQKATSIIDCEKPTESREHPTMKPIKLFGYLMRNSSKPGQIVLDTFGGSGTTLITAEQLGRRARLMEIDPHYCDVILARWEKLTGKQAKRLDE